MIAVAFVAKGLSLLAVGPRLVVSGDLSGARYVRDLVDLRIVNLSQH
jgi:hypothetical protein